MFRILKSEFFYACEFYGILFQLIITYIQP